MYQFIRNNAHRRHHHHYSNILNVKDDTSSSRDNSISDDNLMHNSGDGGADSPMIGKMSTALVESIDHERRLFANGILKSESWKKIDRVTINSYINKRNILCGAGAGAGAGAGLYDAIIGEDREVGLVGEDREDGEGTNSAVDDAALDDDIALATDKVVAPPAFDSITKDLLVKEEEEEEFNDGSFASVMQSAKHILKLIRKAQQQQERREVQRRHQLQLQQQVEGGISSSLIATSPPDTVDMSIREDVPQSPPNDVRRSQKMEHEEAEAEAEAASIEEQQQVKPITNKRLLSLSSTIKSQLPPKPAVAVAVADIPSLREVQRTAMDTFLSSPTGLNWNELVESIRQQRRAEYGKRGIPCHSSRHDLLNIQTITLDGLCSDDNSSITLSLSSGGLLNSQSQSQQPVKDNQRTAMEAFLSSPTGFNWDDLVKSLRREGGGDCCTLRATGYGSRPESIVVSNRDKEEDDDISSLGMGSKDEDGYRYKRKQRQRRTHHQQQQQLEDGSNNAKNNEKTILYATSNYDSSSDLRPREVQKHCQASHTVHHRRRRSKYVDEARRGKDMMLLKQRVEHVLALTPTATTTDTTYEASDGAIREQNQMLGEMNLNDLKSIDECIALTLTPKTVASESTATNTFAVEDWLLTEG